MGVWELSKRSLWALCLPFCPSARSRWGPPLHLPGHGAMHFVCALQCGQWSQVMTASWGVSRASVSYAMPALLPSRCHGDVQAHYIISRPTENQSFLIIKLNLLISETLLLAICRKYANFKNLSIDILRFSYVTWFSLVFPWFLLFLWILYWIRVYKVAQGQRYPEGNRAMESASPGVESDPAADLCDLVSVSEPHFPHL